MPSVSLTKVAGTVGLSTEWTSIGDTERVNIQCAVAPELAGPGIEITKIQITGRVRNSSSAVKNLQFGFKPALSSNRNTWAAHQGSSVLDSTFQAIGRSSNGSYIYRTFTRTYDAATNSAAFAKFAGHIRESFINGTPVYLGIIQPTASRVISVYVSGYWTITVTYNILGNVPSTNVSEATLGSTVITTSISETIPGSTTNLKYKIGGNVIHTKTGAGNSYNYTVPTSAGAHFPASLTAPMVVEAETFLSGVTYGTITTSVTLKLPADAAPTATATPSRLIVDTIPPISNFIQNKTGVIFAMAGVPKYGATIDSYSLTIEGVTKTGASITRIPLTSSGNVGYSFTVTDSRKLSRTYTGGYISVMSWRPPSFSQFEIKRVNASGVEAIDGWYAKPGISASAYSLLVSGTEYNQLKYYIAYRKITLEGETPASWSISDTKTITTATYSGGKLVFSGGDMLTKSGVLINTFDDMLGYEFQIFFSDYFETVDDYDEMPTKEIIMDINSEAASVAIGGDSTATPKVGETPAHKKFEVYPEAYFYGGIPQLAYSTDETDTGLKWIDGKPVYSKTWDLTGSWPSGADPNFLLSIEEFDLPVEMTGVVRVNSRWANVNFAFSTSVLVSIHVIDGRIYLTNTSNYTIDRIIIHLQYTKSTDTATRYVLPCLTADSSQGCVASASTVINANFPAWQAFNANADTHWTSSASDTNRWIQIQMPHRLKDMVVMLTNNSYATDSVVSGKFLGSNDGSSWSEIGSFSGRPTTVFICTKHVLHNTTGYSYLRIAVTEQASATNASGFSDIRIEGEIASS